MTDLEKDLKKIKHKAFRVCGELSKQHLGKRVYFWSVPHDLRVIARKQDACFIGVGRWRNTGVKYGCLATPSKLLFFDSLLLKEVKLLLEGSK